MTKNCENRFIFLSHFLVLQVVLYSGYWLLQGSSLSIQLFSYLVQETIQEQKKDVTIRSPNSTLRPSAKSYLRNHCLLLMAIPASQSSITDHNRRVICSYLIYVWHCITNFRHLRFSTSMWLEKITLKSRVSGEKWSLNSLAHIPISLILLSYIRTTGEQLCLPRACFCPLQWPENDNTQKSCWEGKQRTISDINEPFGTQNQASARITSGMGSLPQRLEKCPLNIFCEGNHWEKV